VQSTFAPIGQSHGAYGENSFWPSFTDIMMVITMIFLMATSLLVVRNWQLVAELKESIAAEQIASQTIEITVQENATLEERLANAEQSNSILRLRALKKDEELQAANANIRQQERQISRLESNVSQLIQTVKNADNAARVAELEVERLASEKRTLQRLLENMEQQLAQQTRQVEETRSLVADQRQQLDQAREEISSARETISSLTETSADQQRDISELIEERELLNQEIESYNQQLLTLKGDYEVVKSKYQELVKPARSAKGKYIVEVYFVKNNDGELIRYKQPGDDGFTRQTLAEVESRLDKLKEQKGKDLYVKIIIPENSGLTYNEAWTFMRNLLVKYDYYYQ
jgi:chromosome segregation ATPase